MKWIPLYETTEMTAYKKNLVKLIYKNLENLESNGSIFILFVASIFPPITHGLSFFHYTFFHSSVAKFQSCNNHIHTKESWPSVYNPDNSSKLQMCISVLPEFTPEFTPGCSISIFHFKHLKSAHYLLSLSHPNHALPRIFPVPQDLKISFELDSSLV